MSRVSKYPKTTGYYVYVHVTPDKMCYFGMSKQQPCRRWFKILYLGTTLEPYINQYGWDSIEHMVIQDGLTQHQAEVIEDWFITKSTKDGFCINKRRSGGYSRDREKERRRVYMREYMRKYNLKKETRK